MPMPYALGAHLSPEDPRDSLANLHMAPALAARRPLQGDLRGSFADHAWDQGPEGTCVAQTLVAILDAHLQAAGRYMELSRRDLYEGARLVAPVTGEGSHPRGALSWAHHQGVCPAADWPYVAHQVGQPGPAATANRPDYKIAGYARIVAGPWGFLNPSQAPDYRSLADAMYARGPVQLTIEASEGLFEPARSGDTWLAQPGGAVVGLHSVAACGWRDGKPGAGEILIRNSWGPGWGDAGYAWIPAATILREAWLILPWSYQDRPAELPLVSWQQALEAQIWPW